MKQYLLLLFICLTPSYLLAQDIITKKDGTAIEAKIIEVSPSEIKYKKFSNPDGPTFILPTHVISSIRYQNGEKETFVERAEAQPVVTNGSYTIPKYRDIKDLFDRSSYTHFSSDKYSPGWCGFASFVIPGLGQAIEHEWGRAAGFFFGNLACNIIAQYYLTLMSSERNTYRKEDYGFGFGCFLTISIGLNICSIVDAVHIAKAKNLWCLQMQSSIESINISPSFTYLPTDPNTPIMGINMSISF